MTTDASAAPGLPRPGPQHERLRPFVGTFRARVSIFVGPDQTQESTGTMVSRFVLDGLYLHQDYQGDPVGEGFPRFAGQGYWGYDQASGKYEGFWIDNGSTTMQRESGDVDATGRVWTMHSELRHPGTGQLLVKRSVISLLDEDHHEMESYFTAPDGQEIRTMRIKYRRA